MAKGPVLPFRRLLSSSDLKPGEDLEQILAIAWAAQRHRLRGAKRAAAPELTRASCLFAVLQADADIREHLVAAGMKTNSYRRAVSLAGFEIGEPLDPMPADVVPNAGLQAAVAQYVARFPDRHRFDGLALAYGCVATDTGRFVEALQEAGLDVARARDALAVAIEGPATEEQLQTLPPELEAARSAIAVLTAGSGTRKPPRKQVQRAMAFLVSPRHAVTVAHVVTGHERVELRFPAWPEEDQVGVEAEVVAVDEDYDYALLELTGSPPPSSTTIPIATHVEPGAEWGSLFATSAEGALAPTRGSITELQGSADRPVVGLSMEDPGPKIAPGASGAPVLVDGAAVGIFAYSTPDGFGAVPAAGLWSDARIRELLDPASAPPEPSIWVTVAGTEADLDEVGAGLTAAIGRRLAAHDLGLTTGGGTGVDYAVALAYSQERVMLQRPAPMRVVDVGRDGPPLFRRAAQVQVEDWVAGVKHGATVTDVEADDWLSGLIQSASLVILLDGGGSVRKLASAALDEGVPVLPLPVAGTTPRGLHPEVGARWEERPVPGLTRDEFEQLAQAGIDDTVDLVDQVLAAVSSGAVEEPAQQAASPSPEPIARPDDSYLQVANDAVSGVDRLNLESRAKTFAQVMVARSLKPPLAIGLFGPWGSGKSYFMELIERFTKEFARTDSEQSWQHVCQIKFNAWHYMDSDLWATLAGRIFDGMAEYLAEGKDGTRRGEDVADKRRKLRARLRSSLEARDEAKRSQELAQKTLAEQQTKYEKAQAKLLAQREALGEPLREELWNVLKAHGESLAASPDEAKASVRALLALSGRTSANGNASDQELEKILAVPEQVGALADEFRSTYAQVRQVVASFKPEKWWGWAFGVLVVFGPIIAQIVLDAMGKSISVNGVTTVLGQAAAVVIPKLTAVREQLGHMSTLNAYATSVRERAEETRRIALQNIESYPKNSEAHQQKKAHDSAASELHEVETRLAEIEQTIADARSELDALDSGKAVYEFVLERGAEGGRYRSREGIVSMVRRDLETLSGLLKQWERQEPEQPEAPAKPMTDDERADLKIQRIILYIDDLDRCPRERVVEVLQAVHLLLAFDLFVVVVGVDPRWLERSLEGTYENLVGDGAAETRRFHHPAATAQDYLEKIFQIPFTLPAVEDTGFANLVADQLKLRSELEAAQAAARREAEDARTKDEQDASEEAVQPAAENTAEDEGDAKDKGTAVEDEARVDEAAREEQDVEGEDAQHEEGEIESPLATEGKNDGSAGKAAEEGDEEKKGAEGGEEGGGDAAFEAPGVQGYYVESWEREFLNELHDLLHTPRAIKRFVNVYRLIRVGVSEDEYERFAGDRPDAHFRIVALLLAVNTGFPRPAARMLRGLGWPNRLSQADRFTDFADFVKRLDPGAKDPLLAALEFNRRELAQLEPIHRLLTPFVSRVPSDLDVWSRWAREVGRYSMYWRAK